MQAYTFQEDSAFTFLPSPFQNGIKSLTKWSQDYEWPIFFFLPDIVTQEHAAKDVYTIV